MDDYSKWSLLDLTDELNDKMLIFVDSDVEDEMLRNEFKYNIRDICEEILERLELYYD